MARLTTPAKVRDELGTGISTEFDDFIGRKIDAASARIVGYCGQPILAGPVVWTFRGGHWGSIVVPFFPVSAITALAYLTSIGEEPVAVEVDGYELVTGTNGAAYLRLSPQHGTQYQATLTVGYSADPWEVPADVEQVCLEMVVQMVRQSGHELGEKRLGVDTISKGGMPGGMPTISTRFIELTDRWQHMLNPYRVPVL